MLSCVAVACDALAGVAMLFRESGFLVLEMANERARRPSDRSATVVSDLKRCVGQAVTSVDVYAQSASEASSSSTVAASPWYSCPAKPERIL